MGKGAREMEDSNLDAFDLKIIRALSRDGRMTLAALSEVVGLSKTPCQARIRRLEKDGYILGYKAIFSPVKRINWEAGYARVGQSTNYDRLLMEVWTAEVYSH